MSLNTMILKVFLLVAAAPAVAAGPDLLDLEYRPLASQAPVNLAQRHAGQLQPEGGVLQHRQMRK